jgi:hypothetical protein
MALITFLLLQNENIFLPNFKLSVIKLIYSIQLFLSIYSCIIAYYLLNGLYSFKIVFIDLSPI